MGRVVVFGATGYTGRLTAEALAARGEQAVLAGRSRLRLQRLADELGGGLAVAEADVAHPDTVRRLVEPGDVLVSTVGPFCRWGEPAVRAAIAAKATYLDSTGEPPFIRAVFSRWGPEAAAAGCGLLTAFGYDWVPGNLAGGLALREAGSGATRVDVGYFVTGRPGPGGMSGGTRASAASVLAAPSYAWRDGRLATERPARRYRTFRVHGTDRSGVTVGGSEHFALPRLAAGLRDVNVYLGWFGPLSRPVQGLSLLTALPPVRSLAGAASERMVHGSTGGPDAAARARTSTYVQAVAYDAGGEELARVVLAGPNPYTLTGALLAWAAVRARDHGVTGAGALGPVDAFGLDALEAGCAEAGLTRAAG